MKGGAVTREQLNATPPELRHYTCQQCGKNDTDRRLFKMIVTFGIGFVFCRICLGGER